jgi:MFS family permease
MIASRPAALGLIILCQVGAMALWFSATAIVPALKAQMVLDEWTASLFTSGVHLGFVLGSLISAILGLADRLDPRKLFMTATLIAASANAAILFGDPTSDFAVAMRIVTGACMAGIYPVGMKLASTWSRDDMGLMIGLLVGAMVLGQSSPHLFNALGGVDWQLTMMLASGAAVLAAFLIHRVSVGPNVGPTPRFEPRAAARALTDRGLRLANIGYLGHMWELFAMYAWIAVFLDASFRASMADQGTAAVAAAFATFATVAVGAIGCVAGGLAADRWGRTTLTIAAMAISGSCCIVVGFLFGGSPVLLVALCLIWGIAIIADSAQFSASIAELSDSSHVGTMLTVQVCLGFLLTLLTIHLIPVMVVVVGWTYAFACLAIGPFVGVYAMWRLRISPDALKLAGGRR